jgi:hypothetical protein
MFLIALVYVVYCRNINKMYIVREGEVAGGQRKFLIWSFMICSLHCIIRIIKLRRMRWAGYVACMGENSNSYRTLWEKVKDRDSVNVLVTGFEQIEWESLERFYLAQGVDQFR